MSDLLRTLAFAFRRKGTDAMPGTDLRLLLAYDLRWFAPEDAKRVVLRARDLGLLSESDGVVRPTFDPARVDVPVNFRPTVSVLDDEAPADLPPLPPPRSAGAPSAPPAAPAPAPVAAPPASAPAPVPPSPPAPAPPAPPSMPAPAVPAPAPAAPLAPPAAPSPSAPLVEAERARRGGMMRVEVAALVVARRAGEDVSARLAEAEARILKG